MSVNSPPFDDWLFERREHYRRVASGCFERAVEAAIAEKRFADAVRLGIRLVALEPLREDLHRTLMRCYAALGRIPDALQQYRQCRAILERELEVAPSRETELLKVRLMSERSRTTQPAAGAAGDGAAEHAGSARRTELRQVTLLALAPGSGATPDPLAEDRELDRLMRLATDTARRYSLADPVRGSHGVVLVFGCPRTSSNDSLRALRAARELASTEGAALAAASGRAVVYFGDSTDGVERIERLSGAVLRQVELMSSLGEAHCVLISDPVRLSCIDHVAVSGPVGMPLPGQVPVWRLDSVDFDRPVRPLPGFVGRRIELTQLAMMLELCREGGHGHVFMLRGDAGIGKTRLAHKALDAARAGGDGCLQYRVDVDAGADASLVEFLVRAIVGDPGPASAERLAAVLNAEPELLRYAGLLIANDESARREFLEAVDVDELATYERRMVEAMVEHACRERPLVLLVENIHHAGGHLLALLASLAALTTRLRLVLIMTSRLEGEALSAAWRGAMGGAPMTTIDLQPLAQQACRQLAERLAGSDHPRLEDCVTRSGGNPLFLEQLLLATDHGDRALPDSIQSIVAARLDAMPASERRVVRAAAVIGPRFSVPAPAAMVGAVEQELDGLMARAMVIVSGDEGRFLHDLVHRGIVDQMLTEERREFHRLAAKHFRELDDVQYAWHATEAALDDAEAACLKVCERLLSFHEYDRVLALADRALARNPESVKFLYMKARVLQTTGATAKAVEACERALKLAHSPPTVVAPADALIVLDRYDEALERLDALEQTGTASTPKCRPGPTSCAAASRSRAASSNAASTTARTPCAGRAPPAASSSRSKPRAPWPTPVTSRARWARQRSCSSRAIRLAAEHDRKQHAAINLAMLACCNNYLCRVHDALDGARRAHELARAAGHRRHEAIIAGILAQIVYRVGDTRQALDYAGQALQISRSVGSVRFENEALCAIGHFSCVLGDAKTGFRQALEAARRMVELRPAYAGPWLLAVAARFAPDAAGARELLHEGEVIFREIECVSHNHVHFYQYAIDRMLLDGDADEARRYVDALGTHLDGRDIPMAAYYRRRGELMVALAGSPRNEPLRGELEALRAAHEGLDVPDHEALSRRFAP
ncbi:MAG: AAA family ATPase [Gammaproteobacteria bacterium]|nr:AAA family ATPase [Gammaproteobacteria bacterium]